ncbi:MAG: DUF4392 domain-containing protein [Oscillospiraceae bacterium]|jgi:hypothetical protein|nr:DUF4392 domain-containing protein [Oscillospiraceae bacterium]
MTAQELAEQNIGQDLDDLMNLDPRGYGVCRILYAAARKRAGQPLAMLAAKRLLQAVGQGDFVYILTGFVLLPHKKAEMDGIIGSVMLARALVKALGAKPVVVCPQDNLLALRSLAPVAGLHLYEDLEELRAMPIAMGSVVFTKDAARARAQADALLAAARPAAVVSIEAPGANAQGVYHNAWGQDVSDLEAKSDVLFRVLQQAGVLNIAIGDLGNEIGMGAIADQLSRYIPGAADHPQGGIAANTAADYLVTATVSDWGAYALCAALAYLCNDPDILHTRDMQREAMVTASRSGMVDQYGWLIPAIDGIACEMHLAQVDMMRACVTHPAKLRAVCDYWFQGVLSLGYFDEERP